MEELHWGERKKKEKSALEKENFGPATCPALPLSFVVKARHSC
jgi:hypothetical protein